MYVLTQIEIKREMGKIIANTVQYPPDKIPIKTTSEREKKYGV